MRYALAVDLGGTSIKFGLVSEAGDIVLRHERSTPKAGGPPAVVAAIAEGLQALLAGEAAPALAGVGIGIPGLVDPETKTVALAPNLGWADVPAGALFAEALPWPVALENDARAALLGERWRGAARGVDDVLLVTLGTGVGGAVLSGGRLLRGARGLAGEIGHLPVHPAGARCGCGAVGCLETEASATALVRHVEAALRRGEPSALAGRPLSPVAIAQAAEAGDAVARAAFDRVGRFLGLALAGLANALNPALILLGGGLASAEALFRPAMRAAFSAHVLPAHRAAVDIRRAALGNDAGLVGAAYAAFSAAVAG
ncbi:MAG: ROK family protein [Hydrogenibacillus schlegelii]|uniref:ROK family protein n=1 Tax=Hydrogenibacillus schlegelii TaxID=1484 RepID=A0A947CW70_HYDSH|nr:ROK family protein [Hydrogenibacillus schlegelii]